MNQITKSITKMTTVEIAKYTGKEHRNVLADTRKMLAELYSEKDVLNFKQIYKDAYGREQRCYSLEKADVLTLVSGYSIPLRAKIIRRIEELESGKAIPGNVPASLEDTMIAVKYAAEILKVSEASKLEMVQKTFELSGIPTAMLPVYVEKARVVFSATELLKRIGSTFGVRAFNVLLMSKGFLEEKTRPSTKGRVKTFKALTEAGLAYGQNDVSPQNKLEVQPHYFEDTFQELYERVVI
jgi:phage regulator Rha-like protein